jgi:hypothetical protein
MLYALAFIVGAKTMFVSLVILSRLVAQQAPNRSPVQKLKIHENIVTRTYSQ